MSEKNDVDFNLGVSLTRPMYHPLDREEGRTKNKNSRMGVRAFIHLTGHKGKVLTVLTPRHQRPTFLL